VVTENVVSYILLPIISEGSCGHRGCCAIHFGSHHPRRLLWSLIMLCHTFWFASSQKALVVTENVVLYILVPIISEGSCGHRGCCAIHFVLHHPRRLLWSLRMLCYIFWCTSSQKVLVVTENVVPYILVHIISEGSCGH